jgi:UPF0755 protein
MNKQTILICAIVAAALCGAGIFGNYYFFNAPQSKARTEQFAIPLNANGQNIVADLYGQGFIKSKFGFDFVLLVEDLRGKIRPGGFLIAKSMSAWQISETFARGPSSKWVVIPEGWRKEQIAETFAKTFGWTDKEKADWITGITAEKNDYFEGVYFPDTYLLPSDETPAEAAQRLIDAFNENFALYAQAFANSNIKWTTALKIASLVQREGLGKEDMPLIAGIIWNRLEKNMRLQIDATVQYARDNELHFTASGYNGEGSWWSPIKPADEKIDSPYNTYLYAGLPPHPIAEPGLEAIKAVLDPAKTDCLYYLHDKNGQIHCAVTLQEHDANIEKYLIQ